MLSPFWVHYLPLGRVKVWRLTSYILLVDANSHHLWVTAQREQCDYHTTLARCAVIHSLVATPGERSHYPTGLAQLSACQPGECMAVNAHHTWSESKTVGDHPTCDRQISHGLWITIIRYKRRGRQTAIRHDQQTYHQPERFPRPAAPRAGDMIQRPNSSRSLTRNCFNVSDPWPPFGTDTRHLAWQWLLPC